MRIFKRFILGCIISIGMTAPRISVGEEPPPVVPPPMAVEESDLSIAPLNNNHEPLASEIFGVLVGEIAGLRGQIPLAIQSYLDAARLSRNAKIAERAVHVALFANDFSAGSTAAQLWHEIQPNNSEALQLLVIFSFRTNNADGTITALEKLIALLLPKGADSAYEIVAALLTRENNPDLAKVIINQLIERTPARYRPEVLLVAGKIHLDNKHPDLALTSLDQALEVRPNWTNAIILRARALQLQNKHDLALDYLAEAVKAKPKESELRLAYGRFLIEQKKFDRAREEFIILARQQPNNSDILFSLGMLYLESDQKAQAKQQFLRLIKIGAHIHDANFYLGQIAEAANNFSEAINFYKLVREGDNYLNAQIRVAVLLVRKGDLTAARIHLHSLNTKDNPADAIRLILAESELLRNSGYLEDALKILSQAIAELPDSDLLYTRAMIAEQLNRIDILEQDLKTILKNEPDNVQALNAMGYTLADRTNRYQEALGYIKRALVLRPNDFYILDSMGWVQYRLKNYSEAARYLNQALALKPDPEIAAHLGEVLWVMGNQNAARKIWQRALKENPDAKIIRDTMDRFLKH